MRLTHDEYFLSLLAHVANRSTCPRRSVGAIIVDARNQILSTGYNGVPRGVHHCTEPEPETIGAPAIARMLQGKEPHIICQGRSDEPGDSSRCMAVHAEQNALLQCRTLELAHTLYVTCTPCFTCAKMIANTPIKRVVCLEHYAERSGILESVGVQITVASGFKPS